MIINNSLQLKLQEGKIDLLHKEIMYCKASSNYSIIYLNNGKKIWLAKTLKWLELNLPSQHFIRVHRSQIINTQYLQTQKRVKDAGICTMANNINLSIARRKTKQVFTFFNN
jgi:two-component system, LytTR family, response regulator